MLWFCLNFVLRSKHWIFDTWVRILERWCAEPENSFLSWIHFDAASPQSKHDPHIRNIFSDLIWKLKQKMKWHNFKFIFNLSYTACCSELTWSWNPISRDFLTDGSNDYPQGKHDPDVQFHWLGQSTVGFRAFCKKRILLALSFSKRVDVTEAQQRTMHCFPRFRLHLQWKSSRIVFINMCDNLSMSLS